MEELAKFLDEYRKREGLSVLERQYIIAHYLFNFEVPTVEDVHQSMEAYKALLNAMEGH